jgi:hypothetical protein
MASSPACVVGDQAPVTVPADLAAHLTDLLVADLDDGDARGDLVAGGCAGGCVGRGARRAPSLRPTARADRGAGDRRMRMPDQDDVVRGDQRVGRHAGPGRARLPRRGTRRPGVAVRGDNCRTCSRSPTPPDHWRTSRTTLGGYSTTPPTICRPARRAPSSPPPFRPAYQLARQHHGDDHPDTLDAAGSLAIDLHPFGEYVAARELDQDTLDRCRRVLGENHPSTLTSANNLAADLCALGEHVAAEKLQRSIDS